jgi:HSP20 family molecular chaperone IbpA
VRTKGLSFKHLDVDGTDFVLLDSAGSNAPVRVENELSVYQKEATEHFILDIIFEISDYFICVVNDFTSLDQRYLDKLARTLQASTKSFREVIVVHNFKDVTSASVLEHLWDTQVTQIYNGGGTMKTHVAARDEKGVLRDKTVVWFKTQYSRHICLAHGDSLLGKSTNPWAISLLRYWLKSVVVPAQRQLSITDNVVGLCSEKLAVCFKEENIDLKVFPKEGADEKNGKGLVSYIRPANPEHNKRFRLPQITLHGSSVVLARPDSFMPPVDILKTKQQFTLMLDTPGLGPDDIFLSRVNTTTVIKGRRAPLDIQETKRGSSTESKRGANGGGLSVAADSQAKAGKTGKLGKADEGNGQNTYTVDKQERKYGDFTVTVAVPTEYKKRWSSCHVQDGVLTMTFLADEDQFELQPEHPK